MKFKELRYENHTSGMMLILLVPLYCINPEKKIIVKKENIQILSLSHAFREEKIVFDMTIIKSVFT